MVPPDQSADKVAPVDSKAAGKRGQGARGGAVAAAATTSKGADSAAAEEPPMPMKKDANGKKIVDKEAHARMFPGGAVLVMKNFQVRTGGWREGRKHGALPIEC